MNQNGMPPKATNSNNSSQVQDKKMRCLIIQMASLGDCLQSLLALKAAKQLYPNLEIHFLAREKFVEAAQKTPWIQSVFAFPTQSILGPVIQDKQHQGASVREIAKWMGPIIEHPWDMVVNWSFSEASSYLTAIIPARIKLGYSRRADSSFISVDGWSQYLQGIVQERTPQNIHLTDILTTQLLTALQIHIGDPSPNGEEAVTSKNFFTFTSGSRSQALIRTMGPLKKWVGIQLGSGKKSKEWGSANWAKLAELVLKPSEDLNILLLGNEQDIEQERLFFTELSPKVDQSRILSLVGKTSFEDWAYAISRCSWLFTGETASVPLSGTLATPVILISNTSLLAAGQAGATPYGNGSYILSPLTDDHRVKPEAVYGVWSYARRDLNQKSLLLSTHLEQMNQENMTNHSNSLFRVYRSMIRPAQNGGGVSYEQLIPDSKRKAEIIALGLITVDEWLSKVVGHIARAWYCGWVPPVGQELKRDLIGPSLIQHLRALEEASEVMLKIYAQAIQTADHMQKKAGALKSEKLMALQDKEEFRKLGQTLIDLDSLVDRIVVSQPCLKIFSSMEKVFMHNLRGQQLAELGKETHGAYKRIHEGVQILKQWIGHTLELARPMSVQTTRSIGIEGAV